MDFFKKNYIQILVQSRYGFSFFLLSIVLKTLPLGTAYANWAGAGNVLTALVRSIDIQRKIECSKDFRIHPRGHVSCSFETRNKLF
ncbi:DMT family transporter [Paenibacillus sp. USHLN196]|uniref:DMT family transporter n=1 Tax=Paenibacillus sp. USHLN196 TaxID=3081291 RepID=UPI00301645C0